MIKNLSWRQVGMLMAVWAVSTVSWAETGVTNLVNGVTNSYPSGLIIGTNGSLNALIVTNAGQAVVTGADSIVGNAAGANNNLAVITGVGSLWTNSASLTVGSTGSFNRLTIANGGQVISTGGLIGEYASSSNNYVLVTDAGSVWTNSGNLYVGVNGSSNRLDILNGGHVFNAAGFIDSPSLNSSSNYVLVSGTGSLWKNSGNLVVGDGGVGNQLVVADGGTVVAFTAYLGYSATSSNNSALVTGAGSVWTNSGDLYIGFGGSSNQLTIANGGHVFDATGYIDGAPARSSNNYALVTGAGSVWRNSGNLYVGYNGPGNRLDILNGGQVFDVDGYVDVVISSSSNSVLVSGAGSIWNNSGNLYVGNHGVSNQLTIANGGTLLCSTGYIGYFESSWSNSVLVTGSGSLWSSSGDLHVGNSGSFNRLSIASGGRVVNSGEGSIGYWGGANNNSVVVNGAGSLWTNGGDLEVGYGDLVNSSGNQLSILNGGEVNVASNTYIGQIGSSNSVLVSGIGSTLTSSNLMIGYFTGTNVGNSLTIDQGGSVNLSGGLTLFNNDANNTNNSFHLNSGTLTTRGNSLIEAPAGSNFVIGTTAGQSATWNILGGNNWIDGNTILGGAGSTGAILVQGAILQVAGDLSVGTLGTGLLSLQTGSVVNISNNYIQGANGTLSIAIAGTNSGQYGHLSATTASLNGTLQLVRSAGFIPHPGDQVDLIDAGVITGSFSNLDNRITGAMRANLNYSANEVSVNWTQGTFSPFGLTPNQRAVGGALDSVLGDPRAAALIGYLDGLTGDQLPGALELISPSQLSAVFSLGFAGANVQSWNLLSRVNELRNGMGGFSAGSFGLFDPTGKMNDLPQFAANNMDPAQQLAMSQGAMARSKENPWGVFVSGAGEFAGVQGTAEASGYHLTTAGMTVGADYRFNDQFALGVAMGYGSTYAGLANDGRIDVDSARGNLYGVWFNEGWHVEGSVGGGYNIYDTKRATIGGAAKADATGTELEGMLGTGYDWQNGPWTFGPFATLQYTTLGINSFNEKGSMVPLHIESQDQDSLQSLLGMHLGYRTKAGSVELMPDVHAGWQHEFFSQSYALDSRFASGAGDTFRVNGPEIGRESAVVGCGLSVKWSETISTYVNYNTELGRSNYDMQSVTAGIRLAF